MVTRTELGNLIAMIAVPLVLGYVLVGGAPVWAQTFVPNDDFAKLVFRPHPTETRLSVILNHLGANETDNKPTVFVVREWIKQKSQTLEPRDRRCVIVFPARNARNEVMMSLSFDPNRFPENLDFAEVWGWDEEASVFNYYKLVLNEWRHFGFSPRADDPPALAQSNRCLQCHRSGVPVMKELHRPWINWESTLSPNAYLHGGTADSWPVTQNALFNIGDASQLEGRITASIGLFNRRVVTRNTSRNADRSLTVRNARWLLKPLFKAREFNLISSQELSRLSPFDPQFQPAPGATIDIPNSFFLNAALIAGADKIRGLEIDEANQFVQVARVPLDDYVNMVRNRGLRFAVQETPNSGFVFKQGFDADFAWVTPERSFVDDYLVDRLIRGKLVSREFVAAALLVDLRNPFSSDLESIFDTEGLIPNTYTLPADLPSDHREHPLTKHVLSRLEGCCPAAQSPLTRFRQLLSGDDPIAELTRAVKAYKADIEAAFPSNAGPDMTVVSRLFDTLLERRKRILRHAELSRLDETRVPTPLPGESFLRSQALLPLP